MAKFMANVFKGQLFLAILHSTLGVCPLFDGAEPTQSQLTSAKNFLAYCQNSKVVFVIDIAR